MERRPSSLEDLSKLTGELAHEIKNPLSTIKVNLDLIAEELDAADADTAADTKQRLSRARRKVAVVRTETDRLQQILQGFLRYLDRPQLQLLTADINQLLGELIDFYQPQAQSHNVTVRQSLCADPLTCKVDPSALKQAILNLFINAQQAMPDGGELMIRSELTGQNARIQISDTGAGIAKDKLPRVFDPFYSSRPGGSGLGLPTAKRIIESHPGKIDVTSALSKGTLFTIELPLSSQE